MSLSRRGLLLGGAALAVDLGAGARRAAGQSKKPTITVYRDPT